MVKNSKVKSIKAREILDSRGNPTIEVDLITELGLFQASVPAGASRGKYEAAELRDGGKRYQGMGVLKAVKNINNIIAPKLKGKEVISQKEIDEFLIKLDGTEDKSRLGANAILAVSMAICRAGAAAKNIPLYQHLAEIHRGPTPVNLAEDGPPPIPCFNVINGGVHAGNDLDFQEFMVIPQFKYFTKNLKAGIKIYQNLKKILKKKFKKIPLGDEGGFAPSLKKTEEALNLLMETIKSTGYLGKVKIGLDCAATQFFKKKKLRSRKTSSGNGYRLEGKIFSQEELLDFYQNLIKNYPIIFLEDPFSQEDDWQGWRKLKVKSEKLKVLIIGDDLTVTNSQRIKLARKRRACNAIILKPNQIGTVSETITAAKLAKSYGWKIIVSHRSGETMDKFIADLAVGIGADFIKSGAPSRPERMAKYNRLLEIEKEIKK